MKMNLSHGNRGKRIKVSVPPLKDSVACIETDTIISFAKNVALCPNKASKCITSFYIGN